MPQNRRKRNYDNRYRKAHYKNYCFRMVYEKDKELMDYYDQQPNKNEYIKSLIAEDMKKAQLQ